MTIAPKASAADRTPAIQPYDLPALRAATTLTLSLPRYGFYTTPAFLALWNTNDSNQHRVTANQALLVALGQAFTAENTITPFSAAGLDANHAVGGQRMRRLPRDAGPDAPVLGEPARLQRPQRLPGASRNNPGNPRPTGTLVDEFAFGDVRATGASIADFGSYLAQVTDGGRPAALRHLGRAAALLLRELLAVQRERRRVPPHRRRVQGQHLQLRGADEGVLLVADRHGRGRDRQLRRRRGARSASRAATTCARRCRTAWASPTCARRRWRCRRSAQTATARIAASVAADAFSRGAAVAGDAGGADACSIAPPPRCCARTSRRRSWTRPPGAVYTSSRHPGRDQRHGGDRDGLPAQPPAARAGGADPDGPPGRGRAGGERIGVEPRQPPACGRRSRSRANRRGPSGSDSKGGTSMTMRISRRQGLLGLFGGVARPARRSSPGCPPGTC